MRRVDTLEFLEDLLVELASSDASKAASLFGRAQSIIRELEHYRTGGKSHTLDDRERVARICRTLGDKSRAERVTIIRRITGFGRTKAYELMNACESAPTRTDEG